MKTNIEITEQLYDATVRIESLMTFRKDGSPSTYTWGYYCTQWIYAETFRGAIRKGLKWAARNHRKQYEKYQKKAARSKQA